MVDSAVAVLPTLSSCTYRPFAKQVLPGFRLSLGQSEDGALLYEISPETVRAYVREIAPNRDHNIVHHSHRVDFKESPRSLGEGRKQSLWLRDSDTPEAMQGGDLCEPWCAPCFEALSACLPDFCSNR